jgi:hypothetical protein
MTRSRDNASNRVPGTIIERLSSVCDGSVVTVSSGTYTFQNVTGQQNAPNSFTDINGSVLSYTPPVGTRQVKYTYNFSSFWQDTSHSINHYTFYIDGVEVTRARHNRSAVYNETRDSFEWVINIGGTADSNVGRQSTWTAAKNLKMQFRAYSDGANSADLNGTIYWNGAGGFQLNLPVLTIEAIA